MDGSTTNSAQLGTGGVGGNVSGNNPFGMPQSWLAWQQGLQGLGNALGSSGVGGGGGGSNFMRANATPTWNPGTANALMATILQMRNAQAAGLAQPFQSGTGLPRVSLLNG